ncbi:glycosyltransferase family 4 protein [Verrucomicrobiota bacterium sgz303538]
MRVAHVLGKYEPAEWSGGDTALLHSLNAFKECDILSVVVHPHESNANDTGVFAKAGHPVQCFHACLPIWGLPPEMRRDLIALDGDMMSFDLVRVIRRIPALDLIHTHTLGRIGAISRRAARLCRVPCVGTLPGGALDLPEHRKSMLPKRPLWSCEWGKLFSYFLGSHQLLQDLDAIIATNLSEAGLLAERYPGANIHLQPHGVCVELYETNFRAQAEDAFPVIAGRTVLLCPSRIDPSRNQQWLLYQLPGILKKYPNALLVFTGACANEHYTATLKHWIAETGLQNAVLMTGILPATAPRRIGLFQHAAALVLPSVVETCGVGILEAWASGLPVISNRTSVASMLIHQNKDGWLFDLTRPDTLYEGLQQVLSSTDTRDRILEEGRKRVRAEFDSRQLAGRLKALYEELIAARDRVISPVRLPYRRVHVT